MNFQNLLEVASESVLQNSHFLLEVTSNPSCRILTSECRRRNSISFSVLLKKELDFLFCVACLFLCVLFERNRALFIALWKG